jgi:uroporphyrinogen decarboxylase
MRVDPEYGIRTKWIEHATGGYWDYCDFPLAEADEETVERWPMPSPDDYDYDAAVAAARQHKEYACFIGHAGTPDVINSTGMLRSMQTVFMDLITENPAGLRLIDRKIEVQFEVLRRTLEKAKGLVDFLWMGEDLGTQQGPIISAEVFDRVIRPRHQRYIDLAKAYDLPVMIHSCGSSSWVYPRLIEMGMDAVDTLQPEAANMAPAYLKAAFGDKLAFHGCISTAGPVAYGTVEDVRRVCRETLDVMMPGGGYCFAPTHALQDNSPTENVVAMYEMAHTHGIY